MLGPEINSSVESATYDATSTLFRVEQCTAKALDAAQTAALTRMIIPELESPYLRTSVPLSASILSFPTFRGVLQRLLLRELFPATLCSESPTVGSQDLAALPDAFILGFATQLGPPRLHTAGLHSAALLGGIDTIPQSRINNLAPTETQARHVQRFA